MVVVTSFQGVAPARREVKTYHESILQASVCFMILKEQCIGVLWEIAPMGCVCVLVDWLIEICSYSYGGWQVQICRVGQQAGDPGENSCWSSGLMSPCCRILSCSGEVNLSFSSDFQLIGWGPLTLRRTICLLKNHVFKCHSHPKPLS